MSFFSHCKYKFALTVGCRVLYWILYFADYGASGQSVQLWFPSLKGRGQVETYMVSWAV